MDSNSCKASPLQKKRKIRSPNKQMSNELMRLSTFKTFPLSCPMHPLRLAQAGYYFEDKDDEVICFACHGKHKNWSIGDNPFQVHFDESQDCPYVQNQRITWNITQESKTKVIKNNEKSAPKNTEKNYRSGACSFDKENEIANTEERIILKSIENKNILQSGANVSDEEKKLTNLKSNDNHRTEHPSFSISKNPVSSHSTITQENKPTETQARTSTLTPGMSSFLSQIQNTNQPLGIVTGRPRYPRQAILSSRLASYAQWLSQLHQKPEDLAKAGLFYEGAGDNVRCFYCGGGLKDWESEDDPWIEHARWFPKCIYLRQCKGEEFVRDVQSRLLHAVTTETLSTTREKESARGKPTAQSRDPAILSVMEMGYNENIVLEALHKFEQTHVGSKPTAEQILQLVFDIEEGNIGEDLAGNMIPNSRSVMSSLSSGDERNIGESLTGNTIANSRSVTSSLSSGNESGDKAKNNCKGNDDTLLQGSVTTHSVKDNDEHILKKSNKEIVKDERTLLKENRELKDQRICKVCLDEEATIVFLPCGHLVSCVFCASALYKCPVCRKTVAGTVKAILP